jgi:hypothetical protein
MGQGQGDFERILEDLKRLGRFDTLSDVTMNVSSRPVPL